MDHWNEECQLSLGWVSLASKKILNLRLECWKNKINFRSVSLVATHSTCFLGDFGTSSKHVVYFYHKFTLSIPD